MSGMFSEHPLGGVMHDEWIAWRAVCIELEHASAAIDINVEHRLHAALVLWGEALVALRVEQPPEVRSDALWEAFEKYKKLS